jgi:hypothetical protein
MGGGLGVIAVQVPTDAALAEVVRSAAATAMERNTVFIFMVLFLQGLITTSRPNRDRPNQQYLPPTGIGA